MKILCVSDHIDPLVYSNSIRERFSDIGIVLAAGDLPLSYYDYIVSSLNKPLLFIFGNHHLAKITRYQRRYNTEIDDNFSSDKYTGIGATYIGGKVVKCKKLLIAGLGGSMKYNDGMNQFSNLGMRIYMLRLLPRLLWNRIVHKRFLDILVTHAPPENKNKETDFCHRGFRPFLTFMRRFRPKYLIHGHIHLYDTNENRMSTYCTTKIVNAYKHIVLNIEDPA